MEIIVSGTNVRKSIRAVIYGCPGIGKTTEASRAPDPLIFDFEDGAAHIKCDRTPVLKSYEELLDGLRWFYGQDKYKSAVIDSLDFLEVKIHDYVCRKQKWESIESPGYGKGYAYAQEVWMQLLGAFDLCVERKKNIICIAHEQIKPYLAPDSDSYDRYQIKLNQKSANLIVARMDAVLFAQYETLVVKDKSRDERLRARGTGERILRTVETPAWVAKNRFNLPDTIRMDGTFFKHVLLEG